MGQPAAIEGTKEASRCTEFCPNDPLCLDDAEPSDAPVFGPTPGPFGPSPASSPKADPNYSMKMLPLTSACQNDTNLPGPKFCANEPLALIDAEDPVDMPNFGPTPGPFCPTP